MKDFRSVFLILCSVSCVCTKDINSNYFSRIYELDNKVYSQGMMEEVFVAGRLKCVSYCNENETCVRVFHNSMYNECRLYDYNNEGRATDDQSGWKCWSVTSCGPPDAFPNALVSYNTTRVNYIAKYTCQSGHYFQGSSQETSCSDSGQWTGLSGACEAVSCGPPASIDGGDVTYTTMTYNSVASYTCQAGYHFPRVGPGSDVTCQANGQWSSLPGPCDNIRDCSDILSADGSVRDGVYVIRPTVGSGAINVYCDMTNDGGGWTVLQRRSDGSEDFLRGWTDYRDGFGALKNELWLGNTNIYRITAQKDYKLRFNLEDFASAKGYAEYSIFRIMDESMNFRLQVSGYQGNAGDSFASYHDGMEFTTVDTDNDPNTRDNCAKYRRGAWWYNNCHESNLNGEYNNNDFSNGVNWEAFRGFYYSLKSTVMKIRPA